MVNSGTNGEQPASTSSQLGKSSGEQMMVVPASIQLTKQHANSMENLLIGGSSSKSMHNNSASRNAMANGANLLSVQVAAPPAGPLSAAKNGRPSGMVSLMQ